MLLSKLRTLIQAEEVAFKSSVSEALATRLAKGHNWAMDMLMPLTWVHNGPIGPFGVYPSVLDGLRPVLFNAKIAGLFVTTNVQGSSGTTAVELYSVSGTTFTSLFSTTPKFAAAGSAPNDSIMIDYVNGQTLRATPNATLPVFNSLDLNAGTHLAFAVSGFQAIGVGVSVTLLLQPR